MFKKISESEAKVNHPEEYADILKRMEKKGKDITNSVWSYDWAVVINNNADPETETDAIEQVKKKTSICLTCKAGRSTTSVLLKECPSFIIDNAIYTFRQQKKDKEQKQKKAKNLDYVLKNVGKDGTSENKITPFKIGSGIDLLNHMLSSFNSGPVYPTIYDMIDAVPEVILEKQKIADGTCIVSFCPDSDKSDDWGFVCEPVLFAVRYVSKKNIDSDESMFVTSKFGAYNTISGRVACFNGFLDGHEMFIKEKEGTEFVVRGKATLYRLTKDEISNQIKGKIFTTSSNVANISKSMGSGFVGIGF